MTATNVETLSFSKLSRFEQCPLSYRLHYVEKHRPEPGLPLRFGSAIHAVIEELVREAVGDERTGPLSEDRALELLRKAWTAEGLVGVDIFDEALQILKNFIRVQGVLEHRDVLAVEKEFRLPVGPFTVIGYIDRVDCVDGETLEVIDYKTNRQLFSREEVDSSLQLGIYHAAVRRLWPWAKRVRTTYWMLRHGVLQKAERTDEQVASALAYVESLGRQLESATEFPARINSNCSYCDHRSMCPAYAAALQGKREFICESKDDLEAVAKEREEVASLAKLLYARKEELERVLKAQLKDKDELVLAGVRCRMFNATKVEYPPALTLKLVGEATGVPEGELLARLATIENKALDAVLKEAGGKLDRARMNLLKAELEAHSEKTYMPRFWAKEE
jgi:RecB family exonuclease